MNELKIFKKEEFGEIRVLTLNNEPWFVGKDVAEKLGYKKARNAISTHVDSEDKKDAPIQGDLGGVQNMTIINESGLYSLILSSKLPNAKKFKRWITNEVLPNIRKNGGYINNADVFINTYFGALDDTTKSMVKGLCKNIEEQQKTITVLKPKAEGFDTFINTENLYKWNVVAKNLGIGRNTMLEILRSEKILMTDKYIDHNGKEKRGENHNVPYQSYMKYFDVKFSMVNNRRCATVLVKASGQDYLRKKLTKLGYIHNVA